MQKLNANDYSTGMTGLKFKLAHKRADNDKWNFKAPHAKRKHLVQFLKDIISQLEKKPILLEFEYKGILYKEEVLPIYQTCDEKTCYEAEIS